MFGEDLPDLGLNFSENVEAGPNKDQGRVFFRSHDRRHDESNAEGAGFIAGGCHDAVRFRATNGNGLAAQLGIAPLLDAGEEGIHVDMDDLALRVGSSVIRIVWALLTALTRLDRAPGERQPL